MRRRRAIEAEKRAEHTLKKMYVSKLKTRIRIRTTNRITLIVTAKMLIMTITTTKTLRIVNMS